MEREPSLFVSLAVGVVNHGPSMAERPNREFGSWDFRERSNKSSSPLLRSQILTCSTVHWKSDKVCKQGVLVIKVG